MFILRKLFYSNESRYPLPQNQLLGESYQTVESGHKEFELLHDKWDNSPEIYCFVVCKGGSEVIPLHKKQDNYIMTSDGKTFENLTLKK